MPSRVIRGEINESETLSMVSLESELAFRALLLAVDDFGRLDARPAKLKAALFPMRPKVTGKLVVKWLEELANLDDPPLVFYEVNGRPYLYLVNWEKHRGKGRRAQDSRYPDPPERVILGNPRKSEDCVGNPPEGRGTRDVCRGTFLDGKTAAAKPPGKPKPWPGVIPRGECKLPEFPADEFPGFEVRPLRFYAELAAPAGNGGGQQHTTEEAAKWHAWQFHTQGLANAKPRGMTLAIKNRWRRLGEFHGGPKAELRKAADWYSSVRFAKRKRALIAENEAKPEVELNYVERLALGID